MRVRAVTSVTVNTAFHFIVAFSHLNEICKWFHWNIPLTPTDMMDSHQLSMNVLNEDCFSKMWWWHAEMRIKIFLGIVKMFPGTTPEKSSHFHPLTCLFLPSFRGRKRYNCIEVCSFSLKKTTTCACLVMFVSISKAFYNPNSSISSSQIFDLVNNQLFDIEIYNHQTFSPLDITFIQDPTKLTTLSVSFSGSMS